MTAIPERMAHIPVVVRVFDPLARRLLARGLPMGPNTILTVRGRRSGLPRQFAVAVAELDGRRWVIGTFGEANWVRNLRSAGTATIRRAGRDVPVAARELSDSEAVAFMRDVLPAYIHRLPAAVRILIGLFLRLTAPDVLDDPARAARTRPVFELRDQ
jgi:deazaflavin-dependent oxidoreductase (nitroreductase family)